MKQKPISILGDIETDHNLQVGEKFNGFSEILVIKNGEIRLFNKSGSEQTELVPHITKVSVPNNIDVVLPGEGWANSKRIEDAKKIYGCTIPKSSWDNQTKVGKGRFTAVNITKWNGEDIFHIPFSERAGLMRNIVDMLVKLGLPIESEQLHMGFKKQWFDYVLEQGGEGVVVKKMNGFEKDWFKVKRIKTYDVVIMGFTEANFGKTGKFAGLIGAIRYGAYDDDGNLKFIGESSGMKDDQRIAFSAARESYIGRVIEVHGDGVGNGGAIVFPRFVRIRDDKPATLCLVRDLHD